MKSPKTRRQRQISRGINYYKIMYNVENERKRGKDTCENKTIQEQETNDQEKENNQDK